MSSFQGFDRKLNLIENTDDRDVLNNLGIAPIADDVSLFTNNLRNTSVLLVTSDKVQGNTITFNPLAQRFVYTNGTKITVFDGQTVVGEYYVGNSNNTNTFQLYINFSLTDVIVPPAGPNIRYVRSDAISKSDILNLVKERSPVIELQSRSQLTPLVGTDVLGLNAPNPYVSIRRVYSLLFDNANLTIAEYMTSIESAIDEFQQKKQKSIVNKFDFSSDQKLTFGGNIIVSDPAGVNNNSVSTTSGPGVFILDTTTGLAKRAFSDNENVWTDAVTDLVGATREIVVGELVFANGVRINRKASLPVITPETNLASTFTHFVKVVVNGEEYSLCLK